MKVKYTLLPFLIFFLFTGSLFAQSSGDIISNLNTWVESQVAGNSISFSSLIVLSIGGVLASLLPCTYPLYPITVSIIQKRSQNSKRWSHPLVYFSGLAFMYMGFGFIAGFTGGAFNSVLRLPETNLIIASFIFILGLSAMELVMLPFFGAREISAGSNTGFFGTFLLGMGAGLISSPCIGPVVVSILLQITTSTEVISFQSVSIAALKMLFFGLGVGIPFLLIGAFGISLPKSGKWMKWIQYTLGALVLYYSYSYYEKAMIGFGFTSKEPLSIIGGLSIVLLSTYLFQNPEIFKTERMKKSLTICGTLVGIFILFHSELKSTATGVKLLSNENPGNFQTIKEGNLTWFRSKDDAFQVAKANNQKVFIDFYADWCTNCVEFKKMTQSNQTLNSGLQKATLYKVMDHDEEFSNYLKDPKLAELKLGLPFFAVFDHNKNLIFKTNDYLKIQEMIQSIEN
ncbi:peptide permease [Leptospira wolffii]|uniref:protein-disulfide reductase DsbD family protein n=1 Tax=Leptospira wolffii TaxID=409998 RepID=UPI00108284DF|nr:cytochrome c biogenesis protein CcdA [Leptospira wolffii]TGL46717.1 peptide permease [Leptospira wolffii]